MNGIKLISTGSAVPKKVVTNDDLAKIVDTNDEWISTRTGIRSRRYCTDGESHTSLCLAAARQALERGGVTPRRNRHLPGGHSHPGFSFPRRRLPAPKGAGLSGGYHML